MIGTTAAVRGSQLPTRHASSQARRVSGVFPALLRYAVMPSAYPAKSLGQSAGMGGSVGVGPVGVGEAAGAGGVEVAAGAGAGGEAVGEAVGGGATAVNVAVGGSGATAVAVAVAEGTVGSAVAVAWVTVDVGDGTGVDVPAPGVPPWAAAGIQMRWPIYSHCWRFTKPGFAAHNCCTGTPVARDTLFQVSPGLTWYQ